MPAQVTNYKCSACGGPLHFVGESGKLECDYCGSSYTVEEIEAAMAAENEKAAENMKAAEEKEAAEKEAAEKEAAAQAAAGKGAAGGEKTAESSGTAAGGQTVGDKAEPASAEKRVEWADAHQNMKSYSCPSCGAELVCDENTAATCCPYCGNQTVIPGKVSGILKPDYILPFKTSKEQAIAALKEHYKGKILLPGSFASDHHINDIQGVYVPFWMYDGNVDGTVNYSAQVITTRLTQRYEVIITRHYAVTRGGNLSFERVPVDGSTRMPDGHMDSIEPFDYKELKPFTMAYMPGFLADKYDQDEKFCASRMKDRVKSTFMKEIDSTMIGYDS